MPNPVPATPHPALLPAPALFDVTQAAQPTVHGMLERIALEHLQLAPNPRQQLTQDSIRTLAGLLMRTGQLIPCIGRRLEPDTVMLFDGQRRLLAAQASHQLAGTEGYEELSPVTALIVLLLDHDPSQQEIRRIQAQANQREELALVDQQRQFADCWQARAGLKDDDRITAVCADLGITAKKAHNLRRQLTLPDLIRERVADRPANGQLSVTMANRLADMHDIAPQLTEAVAQRITSGELHDQALRDIGAFVHRTVVEDEHTYAIRIDDGALLDAADHVDQARGRLDDTGREQLTAILGCAPDKLETELDALTARAKNRAVKVRVTSEIRDRAQAGQFAFVHQRGPDFAAGIWIVDPVFTVDLVIEAVKHTDTDRHTTRDEAFFAGADLNDDELKQAAHDDQERKKQARLRHAQATQRNLGLGHDLRAGLMDPTPGQLHALKALVCHLLAADYRDIIAFGAGWTDQQRQQPVGDTGRHEPRHPDAIIDAELQTALDDPDPLRGIAQLTSRWAAAFVLDPDGITRTKALGTDRMARKLTDALPGGDNALRAAVWEFVRPMLSPALAAMHRDAFVTDDSVATTVRLTEHRADSAIEDLNLDDNDD